MTPAAIRLLLLLLVAAAWAMPAPASAADPWRPEPVACVSSSGTDAACAPAANAGGLWRVAVAPGGRHAYGIAFSARAVLTFDRDPATGALTQRTGGAACLTDAVTTGCTDVRGLGSPGDIAVSGDGRHVYVSDYNGDSLAVFDRNAAGELTQKIGADGCFRTIAGEGCRVVRGLAGGADILVPPGEGELYVYGRFAGVVAYDRDPATGELAQLGGTAGCLLSTPSSGCGDITAAAGAGEQAALTPDGRSVYLPGDDSVAILDRDPATGVLTQKQGPAGCLASNGTGCTIDARLSDATTLVPGPGSAQVYALTASGVLVYARAAGGELSPQSCVNLDGSGGCANGSHLNASSAAAVTPDGEHLIAVHDVPFGDGLVVLEREADGDLVPVAGPDGCVSSGGNALDAGGVVPGGCSAHPAMGRDAGLTVVDDGSFYAGFFSGSSLVAFDRDFYPRCADTTVEVPHNTLVPVGLNCSDRDADPITLVVEQPPVAGSLGAIDQAGARVFYSPFSGFAGPDTFTYRADASGLSSAPARASLTVAGPPAPPPAPTPRVTSPVRAIWGVQGDRTSLLELRARAVPAGGRVQVRCSGPKCPFRTRETRRRGSATVTVFKAVGARKAARVRARTFRAGARVEVRVTAPGRIGRVLRFPIKRAKVPRPKTLCLPLGESRPQARC